MSKHSTKVLMLPFYNENPYQALLIKHLEQKGFEVHQGRLDWSIGRGAATVDEAQIVHIHWLKDLLIDRRPWVLAVKLAAFVRSLSRLRRRDKKIVWTVHNLYAHDRHNRRFDRWLRKRLARRAHALIVHCASAKPQVAKAFGIAERDKIVVIPHGHFMDAYPNTTTKAEARRALGLDPNALLFLFFGEIKPYKGVLDMIDAFGRLDSSAQLLVVGKPDSEQTQAQLQRRVEPLGNVKLHCGFVPGERLQLFLNACDATVLPYRNILTSGGVILAMSFGCPCIAPRMGCIVDVIDERGGFLYDPDEDDALRNALQQAVDHRDKLADMGRHNHDRAQQWNWSMVADMTADVYRRCLND